MAYKMQTGQSRERVDQAIRTLDEMERETQRFKTEAASFAQSIQDDTSREALAIIEEILEIIKRSKKIVEQSGQKAGEGIDKMEQIEKRARQMRGKI